MTLGALAETCADLLPFARDGWSRAFSLAGGVLQQAVPEEFWFALLLVGLLVWIFAVDKDPWDRLVRIVGAFVLAFALGCGTGSARCRDNMLVDVAGKAFATRAQPLVDAIQAYAHDHGAAPPDLAALVPSYLPAVPDPGLWCSTGFAYEPRHHDNGDSQIAPRDDWRLSLRVACGTGVDEFDYMPHERPSLCRHSDMRSWKGGEWRWISVHRDVPLSWQFVRDRLRGVPPAPAGDSGG